jgi:enamine deaminase RidA (YjgF/YER057c/UK114 family)
MVRAISSVAVTWLSRPAGAFDNVGRALAAAGARPEQVTKITSFVVKCRDEYLPAIEDGRVALFGDHKPADTLVGSRRWLIPAA